MAVSSRSKELQSHIGQHRERSGRAERQPNQANDVVHLWYNWVDVDV
jgi:hypothetical protein